MDTDIYLGIGHQCRPAEGEWPNSPVLFAQRDGSEDSKRKVIGSVSRWKTIAPATRDKQLHYIGKARIVARPDTQEVGLDNRGADKIGQGKSEQEAQAPKPATAAKVLGQKHQQEQVQRRPEPLVPDIGEQLIEIVGMPDDIDLVPGYIVPTDK